MESVNRPDGFQWACKADQVPEGGRRIVELGDRVVVIFRLDGELYALDDLCTHDGGPLAEGPIDGYCVVCPRHGARFDIRDGRALTMPATRATASHEVKTEGDQIWIRLRDV